MVIKYKIWLIPTGEKWAGAGPQIVVDMIHPLYCVALHPLGGLTSPHHPLHTVSISQMNYCEWWHTNIPPPVLELCPDIYKEFRLLTLNLVIIQASWSHSAASFAKF